VKRYTRRMLTLQMCWRVLHRYVVSKSTVVVAIKWMHIYLHIGTWQCLMESLVRIARWLAQLYYSFRSGSYAYSEKRINNTGGTTNYKIQTTKYKLQTTNYKLQTTNYKLQIQTTSYKLQTTKYKLQNTNYKLQIQTTNYKLQNTNYKLQNTNYKLQNTNYKLQT
jgi:hypothetical protein